MKVLFRILVVDDDLEYAEACASTIRRSGFEVTAIGDPHAALELIQGESSVELVLTDLKMPTMDGIEFLKEIKSVRSAVAVIIMTGYGTIESAVQAIKESASDYITKPFNKAELLNAIRKIYRVWKLENEISELRRVVSDKLQLDGFVFRHPAMAKVYKRVLSAARCDCSVFISGESGTGKDLVARAIHRNSQRSEGPFVPINCSAISGQLIESELFGYRKGAFTGADRNYDGLFVAANGGTLFLDEIAEMQTDTQAKLLRAVQDKSVRSVGSLEERQIDARFIAATNMNVEEALSDRRLRLDLFHRLNVIQIELPPLRSMRDEVRGLADYFVDLRSTQHEGPPFSFAPDAMRALETYDWPGNVRELQNLVEGLRADDHSHVVRITDLPNNIVAQARSRVQPSDSIPSFTESEKELVIRALRESRGNKSRAAEMLGISRPRLYKKISQYDIKEP